MLNNLSKNDSQLMPFSTRKYKDLPSCLRNDKPNTSQIEILSNVVLKNSTKPNEDNSEPGPSGFTLESPGPGCSRTMKKTINRSATSIKIFAKRKGKGNGKNIIGKENKGTGQNKIYDTTEDCNYAKLQNQKKQDISRSSSTTSVTGTCSNHSDSDIVNVSSDYENYNDDECSDTLYQNPMNVPDVDYVMTEMKQETEESSSVRLNLYNKPVSHGYEANLIETENEYCINDHVLVRYYNRNKWTYYVGIIENISFRNGEFYYNVRFYKTIKKPKLIFKMSKKVDRDDVPNMSIVKKVDLSNNTQIFNSFVLSCEDDEVYFD